MNTWISHLQICYVTKTDFYVQKETVLFQLNVCILEKKIKEKKI
jgi:hypothetical protein